MTVTLIFGVLVVLIALAALFAVGVYNGLVGRRNAVRNGWSQIDVQLKRRHDLVPNLVSAVKGYLEHERGLFENITRARAEAIAAGNNVPVRAEAEQALGQAMRSLFAVAEAYPELKSSQNMLALQEELSSTENRVAFARQHYNDAVTEYNTARETFPAVLFAGSMGFNPADLFELEDATDRAVPEVRF
ncbi:MAG: LemA family protein [Chloroflexota bacterium]